jgi:hypothetical protein
VEGGCGDGRRVNRMKVKCIMLDDVSSIDFDCTNIHRTESCSSVLSGPPIRALIFITCACKTRSPEVNPRLIPETMYKANLLREPTENDSEQKTDMSLCHTHTHTSTFDCSKR